MQQQHKGPKPDLDSPALPWAEKVSEEAPQEEPPAVEPGISLQAAGVEVNDKIEVKWQLDDPDGNSQEKWWGARIMRPCENDMRDDSWIIRYDALYDFEEADSTVIFTSRRGLVDVELDTEMRWRKEGEFRGDTTDGDEDNVLSLSDMVEAGESVGLTKAFEEDEIKKLPASTQRRVAKGLSEFKDAFQEFLAEVAQEKGQGCIINLEDMSKFYEKLGKKKGS